MGKNNVLRIGVPMERLEELAEADKAGRVLILPDKETANQGKEGCGDWILDDEDEYARHFHCSRCGAEIDLCNEIYIEPTPNYCSNCGAKMDREEGGT